MANEPASSNGGKIITAVLNITVIISFLFTIAAAYIANRMAVSDIQEKERDIEQTQIELRKDLSDLNTSIGRIQERMNYPPIPKQ